MPDQGRIIFRRPIVADPSFDLWHPAAAVDAPG
jgi:hypothetical protein